VVVNGGRSPAHRLPTTARPTWRAARCAASTRAPARSSGRGIRFPGPQ
jgi:hypothetical protein